MSMQPDTHNHGGRPSGWLDEDDRHRLLMVERRRIALEVLADRGATIGLEELSMAIAAREGVDAHRVSLSLHHNHLPLMADLGLVDYDRAARTAVPRLDRLDVVGRVG